MRQSREAKAQTHRAIVDQASRLFRERGIEATRVADVMRAADKTHGGFYRHFASKDALLHSALAAAFAQMREVMTDGLAGQAPDRALAAFAAHYLSRDALADVAGGCPVAALSGDVSRAPAPARAAFGAELRAVRDTLAATLDGPPDARASRAAQALAMAVGAMVIARACDPATAQVFLDAGQKGLSAL